MYVYIITERPSRHNNYHTIWTVGHYKPYTSEFTAESDHEIQENAAKRVHYLNGGKGE